MKATLTFKTRDLAELFAKEWSRKTFEGHTVSAGNENVSVTVYDVDEERKEWIDGFVSALNDMEP
jgi:hypothetical protein